MTGGLTEALPVAKMHVGEDLFDHLHGQFLKGGGTGDEDAAGGLSQFVVWPLGHSKVQHDGEGRKCRK